MIYQRDFHSKAAGGIDAFVWQQLGLFLHNVDKAIKQQQQQIVELQQILAIRKNAWHQARQDTEAIESVISNLTQEYQQLLDKAEQKAQAKCFLSATKWFIIAYQICVSTQSALHQVPGVQQYVVPALQSHPRR